MSVRRILASLFLLTLFLPVFSQEYSYTHYDMTDGLAGSMAYCITQDKEGFIWIGTETGLSRFDGTHFVNFTTSDGLADMEVLQMFCDSKGRVWMALFHPSVCYYYKGKIYNASNDTLLRKIHCKRNIESIAEDREGNILLQEAEGLHMIKPNGEVQEYSTINGRHITCFLKVGGTRQLLLMADDNIYKYAAGRWSVMIHTPHPRFSTLCVALNDDVIVYKHASDGALATNLKTGRVFTLPFDMLHYLHQSYSVAGDSMVYSNMSTGTKELNVITGQQRTYLPGTVVSRTFTDNEGNLWFSTLGQGVYRLNSNEIRNQVLPDRSNHRCAVLYLNKVDSELLIGANHGTVYTARLPGGPMHEYTLPNFSYGGLCTFVDKARDGRLIIGTQDHMSIASHSHSDIFAYCQVKSQVKKNESEIFVANAYGVYTVDLQRLRLLDTLWRERGTALFCDKDTLYIGTLNGLHKYWDGHAIFMGDSIPFLRRRISAIARSRDGRLWVASYDAGAIGLLDGRPVSWLTTSQGLSSNICRTLTPHDDDLWIGTDKGLNRVELTKADYPVTRYTAKDGLASDMINAVYIDEQTVYAGTPEGVSYFNYARMDLNAGCRLVILGIASSGKSRLADTPALQLHHRDNNIRFDFAGISYKSAGNITYRYRLTGLDTGWKTTKETFLEYPTLPDGEYDLQLMAVNKFGVNSGIRSIPFSVIAPFWRTAWFYTLLGLSFVSLTWLFASLRIKSIRRQQDEKARLSQRLTEMEHVALQAQMNPHFIFNCLNSIQQYVFDQDVFAANKYITGFAKLIRATLNNSSKAYVPLEDEIDYLSTYLSLEKLRFKDKMNYFIEVDPQLSDAETFFVPPMVIQPYVENSMRHGLRHRREAGGYIRLTITQEDNLLVFVVEDNGIGREKAASFKTREHIEYQSRGMSLTADRIRLINSVNEKQISVEIVDLKDDNDQPAGTRVVVRFPKFDPTYQKNNV